MARTAGALGKKTLALIEASGLTADEWRAQHSASPSMPASEALVEGEKKHRGRPKGSTNKNARLSHTRKDYSAPIQEEIQGDNPIFVKKQGFIFPESRIPRREHIGNKEHGGMIGNSFNHFSGKGYSESLELAYAWAEQNGIELLDWYAQEAGHKAILVSFNRSDHKQES